MLRKWWGRLAGGRRRVSVWVGLVIALAVIGAIVCLNLLERQSLGNNGDSAGLTASGASVDGSTSTDAATDTVLTSEWSSFTGKTLSLKLPAWFAGGVPDDPTALGALEDAVGMGVAEWFELYAQSTLEQSGVELLMAGALAAGEGLIVVTAEVEDVPATASLEAYAAELGGWYASGEVSVEMVTDERAYCRFGFRRLEEGAEAMVARVALVRSARGVILASYTAPAESSDTLDRIFEASAGTIVVRE